MSDSRPLSQTTFRPQVVPPSLAAGKRAHLPMPRARTCDDEGGMTAGFVSAGVR
ncbi:hypothetical protein [Burkholderia ubonensis]|uniref:hypothetical protein n=1 Tax=Burkholderia ubonensis TaxID=101571 RepID=UPI000AAED235|nr:hypothetical protein [Burkholderia ubonensis]